MSAGSLGLSSGDSHDRPRVVGVIYREVRGEAGGKIFFSLAYLWGCVESFMAAYFESNKPIGYGYGIACELFIISG